MSIARKTHDLNGIRRYFSPPKFESKRLTLQARIVFYVNFSGLFSCLLILAYLPGREATWNLYYILIFGMMAGLGLNLVLLSFKKLQISLWSTAIIIYVPPVLWVAFNRGFNDFLLQLIYPIFIYIGLFLRKKGLVVFGLITVAWILLIALLERTNYYSSFIPPITFEDELIFAFIMLISTVFVLNFLIDNTVMANDELDRSAEIAEIANAQKSKFLANMSHELRTPLNAIIGYSDGILEDAADLNHLDEVTLDDITRIRSAGVHLLGLINDILDLSKIEAEQMSVHIDWVDIHGLIHSVSNTVAPMALKNNNQIIFDNQLPSALYFTDGKKLGQILINLLSNAIKYTKGGEVRLVIHIDEDTSALEFSVIDSGIGIPEKALSSIFDSFQQVDGSYNRQSTGTGLGLAITKRFVELLEGDITVMSRVDIGTCFTVRIPTSMQSTVACADAVADDQ